MSGFLIFRLRRRRAVSELIGGVIVLCLVLTALGTVVLVTQQYDQYQTQASRMSQYDIQRLSEYLVANPPGLTQLTSSVAIVGWGTCNTTTYNCYNMTVNNYGGVGVQVVRIYINSTGSGCTSLCVLNPTSTITNYGFNQANQFVNRGEINHVITFALPNTTTLPAPAFPLNTVFIATSRGNLFTFQWPFQVIPGISQEAYSQGIMKVAYQCTSYSGGKCSSGTTTYPGFDSANEPGPIAGIPGVPGSGSGGTSGLPGYCHTETAAPYPAGPGYAEELTGITGLASGGTTLWFVNPWITDGNGKAVLDSVCGGDCNSYLGGGPPFYSHLYTQIYFYVIVVNTGNGAYTPTGGSIDLTWLSQNHFDGSLFGVYYNGKFYTPSTFPASGVPVNMFYYAIFKMDNPMFMMFNEPTSQSAMFWGTASVTNTGSSGTSNEGSTFYSGTVLSSGLWIRYEASTGDCVHSVG